MDKVQMTVTLVEPDLLAYLRQFSDPRERSFMLRMLALRGLQSGRSGGHEVVVWPPVPGSPGVDRGIDPTPIRTPAPTPQMQATPASESRPEGEPPLSVATVASFPAAPEPVQVAMGTSNAGAPIDPLAGIDIGALNDALARY
ncbi:hypothetical protein [Cupriavidus agavae]|uniref:hypothetical protein n=1 Tax=Cupriavidus agavae TaxID=1001822 RepID=UPI001300A1F7|nr:hypothetical protein [Cupriavidus agavae]